MFDVVKNCNFIWLGILSSWKRFGFQCNELMKLSITRM